MSQSLTTRADRDPVRGMIPFSEVCDLIGIHRNTGYAWFRANRFPVPVERSGPRLLKCRRADVDRYLTSHTPAAG